MALQFDVYTQQTSLGSKCSEWISKLDPLIPNFEETPIELECTGNTWRGVMESDFGLAFVQSSAPLQSLEVLYNGAWLCDIPMDVMPCSDGRYEFPYKFPFYGDGTVHCFTFVLHPLVPNETCEATVGVVKGHFESKSLVFPQTDLVRFQKQVNLQHGKTTVDFDLAARPSIGFLIDGGNESIESIVLRLDDYAEKQLDLIPLNENTMYASINGEGFPFHQSKEMDFRRGAPNLSRCSQIKLKIRTTAETSIRIRYIHANIQMYKDGRIGMMFT